MPDKMFFSIFDLFPEIKQIKIKKGFKSRIHKRKRKRKKKKTKSKHNYCNSTTCIHCVKRHCTVKKETSTKYTSCLLYVPNPNKLESNRYCEKKKCVYNKNQKCSILSTTDNGTNCKFFKLHNDNEANQKRIKKRLRKIYSEPQGKAKLISILNQHPELALEIPDVIEELQNYERRYHFEYENPKVFKMQDKW